MLTLKPLSVDWSVAGAEIPAVTFIAQAGLTTRELAHMLDSLVRVSRRVEKNHFVIDYVTGACSSSQKRPSTDTRTKDPMIRQTRWSQAQKETVHKRVLPRTFTPPKESYHFPGVVLDREPALTHKPRSTAQGRFKTHRPACAETASHRLATRQSRQD